MSSADKAGAEDDFLLRLMRRGRSGAPGQTAVAAVAGVDGGVYIIWVDALQLMSACGK